MVRMPRYRRGRIVTAPAALVDLSPWFPGDDEFKPVNIGPYRTRLVLNNGSRMKTMAKWNGTRWCDPDSGLPLYFQNQEWQGLTISGGKCETSPEEVAS